MQTLTNQAVTNQSTLPRIGAVSAILGAVVQVGAGIGSSSGFGTVPAGAPADVLLPVVANQPWLWTAIQLGFVLGPLFWLMAFVALSATLTQGQSNALAKLAATTLGLGAAIHIVSSSINGFGIAALARVWGTAPAIAQADLVLMGNVLLYILEGTWASSITLFHGFPFVLSGLAVVTSGRYPALVGWLGFLGGLGLEWTSLWYLRRATSVEQVNQWLPIFALLRRVYPVSWAAILLPGFYMTATAWRGAGWISIAFAAIILIVVIGVALTGRRVPAIGRAVAMESRPLSPTLRQQLGDPLLWTSIQTRAAIALGIVFLMTVKPGLGGALLTIGVAVVLGLASALPAWSRVWLQEAREEN